MKCIKIFLALILTWAKVSAQVDENRIIRDGNEYFKKQQYDQAAAEYNKVLVSNPAHPVARFNLGNTQVKQKKAADAIKTFSELANDTKVSKQIRAASYYNEGVVLTSQKKLEESIEAYKNALRQDPDDKKARENLQKALLELKKKNPPKQQQKKQDQKKQQQKQQQPKMSQKETEQRLKMLEQKEKEVQERLQKEKSKSGGGQGKDW